MPPPPTSLSSISKDDSALPPLPDGHGFEEGEEVAIRIRGRGIISGRVKYIDEAFGKKRYRGLVVVGEDGIYYTLIPEATTKISPSSDGKKPPTKT